MQCSYAAGLMAGTALLYRFMSQAMATRMSIRGAMIVLLAWLAITFTLSGALIYFIINSATTTLESDDGSVRIMMIDMSDEDKSGILSDEVLAYL